MLFNYCYANNHKKVIKWHELGARQNTRLEHKVHIPFHSCVSIQTSSQSNQAGLLTETKCVWHFNSGDKATNNPGMNKHSRKQDSTASAECASPQASPHGLVWWVWCELAAVEHSPVLQLRRKVLT